MSLRTNGIFSNAILNENDLKNFIYLYSNKNKGYDEVIYTNKYISKDGKVESFNIDDHDKENLKKLLLELQKTIQFDFLLIDLSNINHELEDLILELLNIKKPIYISSKSENVSLQELNLVRLNSDYLNLYLVKLLSMKALIY